MHVISRYGIRATFLKLANKSVTQFRYWNSARTFWTAYFPVWRSWLHRDWIRAETCTSESWILLCDNNAWKLGCQVSSVCSSYLVGCSSFSVFFKQSVKKIQMQALRDIIIIIIIIIISLSSSPLCRVFILIFLRQTMSLGNTVLQLFCCYYSLCLCRQFHCWIYCTFTLVLSEVCVQCPIWLFSVVPWLNVFLVCCSRIFWMTLK